MWEGNCICNLSNKYSATPSKWAGGAVQAKQLSQNLFILNHPTNLSEQRQHCTAHKRGNYNKILSSPIHKFSSIKKSDSSSPEGVNNFPYPRFLLFCKTKSITKIKYFLVCNMSCNAMQKCFSWYTEELHMLLFKPVALANTFG